MPLRFLAAGQIPVVSIYDRNAANTVVHSRPEYSRDEAEIVASWLNGMDIPLGTMAARGNDPWDPINRHPKACRSYRINSAGRRICRGY